MGWLNYVKKSQPELYKGAIAYAGAAEDALPQELVRPMVARVMQSEARMAMIPLQDWLGLDTGARMNLPATSSGNWAWRLDGTELTPALASEIRALARKNARI